jgi:hypothetical protein
MVCLRAWDRRCNAIRNCGSSRPSCIPGSCRLRVLRIVPSLCRSVAQPFGRRPPTVRRNPHGRSLFHQLHDPGGVFPNAGASPARIFIVQDAMFVTLQCKSDRPPAGNAVIPARLSRSLMEEASRSLFNSNAPVR